MHSVQNTAVTEEKMPSFFCGARNERANILYVVNTCMKDNVGVNVCVWPQLQPCMEVYVGGGVAEQLKAVVRKNYSSK